MLEKLTKGNNHIGKRTRHFRLRSQRMICMMLHSVRTISLGIWCVERYVCFWSSWLTGSSSLSTVVRSLQLCTRFSLQFWSVLCVFQFFKQSVQSFPFAVCLWKFGQYPLQTVLFELV